MTRRKAAPSGSDANVKLQPPESRAFSLAQWQKFVAAIDDYTHRLMVRVLYETGCRVGEFVRIQVKHLDFDDCGIAFPAENTKTRTARKSAVTQALINELKGYLKESGLMGKRNGLIAAPEAYLFSPNGKAKPYTTNRIRQIVRRYVRKAELDETYGARDCKGDRRLSFHRLTVHSIRHAHVSHALNVQKVPLPVVQKQVGHKNLKTTAAYCGADWDTQATAYRQAREGQHPQ